MHLTIEHLESFYDSRLEMHFNKCFALQQAINCIAVGSSCIILMQILLDVKCKGNRARTFYGIILDKSEDMYGTQRMAK